MALGRGLASLIPHRKVQDADEVLDELDNQIESADEVIETTVEETQAVSIPVAQESDDNDLFETEEGEAESVEVVTPEKTVEHKPEEAIMEDFRQLEGGPEIEMPPKPNVTPLEFDPETDSDLFEIAGRAAAKIEAKEKVKIVSKKAVSLKGDKWDQHEDSVQHVAIGDITINPLQPRRHFDPQELEELQASINQHGILQPLVVRRMEDGKYELIAGERRLRAAKALKWTKVPAVVRKDVQGDESRMVYALIENIQRQDLDPIELAYAYQKLSEEFGMSHEDIGDRVGKSRVSITNAMRVMQLPAEIQQGLSEGIISPGHARAILMIPDEGKQVRFYKHLVEEGLTVRKAETRARRIQRQLKVHDPMRSKDRKRHPLANKYGPALEERWGTDVNVKFNEDKNRFEVILKAYSMDEFEQLVGRLLGSQQMPDISKDDDVLEA
ncbi:MAG: ParB/RepB/Spo0J family partition protein [Candidatus Andersenbacteria bacterium]|nr:ParB/RepB/Spo0J family partition protein [Candidatus Andersenbacteria bacterium]MBI3251009.1 ParB/RepB/Spo0J family partition protein [Candidatus Andersenbacteria bacterium]